MEAGKIWFEWDVSNKSLTGFKLAAIKEIWQHDNKYFSTHAQAKDKEDKLGWLTAVPNGGIFADKNKKNA